MAALGTLLLFLSGTGVALAVDCYSTYSYYNYQYSRTYYSSNSFYCSNGCCGGTVDAYCCTDSYVDYYNYVDYVSNTTGGVIAGIVIGCLVGVGLFIAFIVLICVYCVNSSRQSVPGQVITTTPGTGAPITYVNTRK
ncbi:uncharacterized protein LOC117320980 [Pecten maximus]|uniref:uncharacterized protein LOC117320980 n=1 Tax=Pecten maximus TaxID=6579 RepID=UPI0014590973|nr:uncharacterized protein LOC117320980 [Pecten maximus]